MWSKVNVGVILLLFHLLTTQTRTANALLSINIPEEGRLNFTELASRFGLECKEYDVTTEDGYVLKLFNIPGNKSRPVLYWHGVLDSADTCLVRGANSSCYSLAADGNDVWIGNSRGNKYSRRHQTLDPVLDKEKFWDFSFNEFGYYDLPASIDFILQQTGEKQLSAIGHSQGNSIFYIMGATRPEYNAKVKLLIAMAPVAFLNNLRGLWPSLIPLWPIFTNALALGGVYEIFSNGSAAHKFIQLTCSQGAIGNRICNDGILMSLAGKDSEELEPEFFRVLLGHYPAGSARKNGDHYEQVVLRKTFGKFDYGLIKNREVYGTDQPPDYNLANVTMPVAILAAENDNFSTLADVDTLRSKLANVVYYKIMERKLFNHLNFIVGKNMNEYINPVLKSLLLQYA